MAKINISTRTPGSIKTNRRKCGWGSVLTTCDLCGRPMVGHNRGICSRCKRSLVGDRQVLRSAILPQHTSIKSALRAQAIEDRAVYFRDSARAQKWGAK